MVQPQEKNGCCTSTPYHLGAELGHAARKSRCVLDALIAAKVSPEITGMRGMLLGYIVRQTAAGHEVYQRDIEVWSRVQRSSVTTILKGMENSGYITRCSVAQDARLKSLVPTEKGLACNDAVIRCIEDFDRSLRVGLSDPELTALKNSLDKIFANLQTIEQEL